MLAGTNLLNNLVEVLTRFRLGKFACMVDLSKCFFRVAVPEAQRDLFRIIWFSNGDLEAGTPQVFCFSRHVWGINSSPYAALLAIKTLISENPTSASDVTLSVVDKNRYMDDVLYSNDSLSELEKVARESTALFNSRRFKLRKWISNSCAKAILTEIPQCDLAPSISEVTIGAEPMPDSKALGVIWNVENDKPKVSFNKNFSPVTTRRQIASQLASNYDPLGVPSPCLLGGKLILQRVATAKFAWDDELPADIIENWNSWISSLKDLSCVELERYRLANNETPCENKDSAIYQLNGFCDASDNAFFCVIYLRRIVNGCATLSFISGRSRVVLNHQSNWVISRKELDTAKICSDLMLQALKALEDLSCTVKFWTDSQVVHEWITNRELHLPRFVKRRIDKIILVFPPDSWHYVGTSINPADVGTREKSFKNWDLLGLWLDGPEFLLQGSEDAKPVSSLSTVRAISVPGQLMGEDYSGDPLEKLIETSPNLYALKKRFAYLLAFKVYCCYV